MGRRESVELAESLGDIARVLLAQRSLQYTLEQIVTEALRLIGPAEHAGIDLVHKKEIEAIAPSSTVAERVDEIQVDVGQGPCLDALRRHEVYRTGNLRHEARWPDFARLASEETGVQSIMGFRLWVEDDTLSALDIYSTEPDAFDDDTEAVGSVLAAHAAIAWSSARKEEQLEDALRTRDVIGQAKGMLMLHYGVDEDRAFDMLAGASQRANVKLRDLAHRFVHEGAAVMV